VVGGSEAVSQPAIVVLCIVSLPHIEERVESVDLPLRELAPEKLILQLLEEKFPIDPHFVLPVFGHHVRSRLDCK
jgi:hypothetical protein